MNFVAKNVAGGFLRVSAFTTFYLGRVFCETFLPFELTAFDQEFLAKTCTLSGNKIL